jgi:hypothetical protein
MPDNSQEPDNYSIDDIIDRLKRRSPDGTDDPGALVTRADGSQAIRVRKRKRRSSQPHKDEQTKTRRMRMIQVSGAFLLIVLAGLAAGGALVFGNSPVFRNRLVAGINILTGADVEMREFRVNPKTANATLLDLTWPEGHVMRHLRLRSINAEIFPASFLGKALTGEEITAGQAELTLDFPAPGQALQAEANRSKPMDIRFKRYAANNLRLSLGAKTSPVLWLRDSEFTLQDRGQNAWPQLLVNRGTIAIPGAPVWRLDRGHVEFRADDIDVIGLRLLHQTDNRGHMKLSGSIQPYETDRQSTLAVQLDSFVFDGLVGDRLGKIFVGRVNTSEVARSNFFSFTPAAETNGVLAITFEGSLATPFEVSGFPAFTLLARLLDDNWFERPSFEADVRGMVRRADGEVVISDLQCENRSRISLKADLRMTKDHRLTGTLRMGIAETMLKSSPNRRLERVFGESRHGFRWVELAISGRADAPHDNFSALYDATPADPAAALPGGTGAPSFEDLTTPE